MDEIEIIKELMIDKDFNQTQLAELSGLSYATVNRILNGKQALYPNTLAKLANALSVEVWEITDNNNYSALNLQVRGYLEFGGEIKRILSFKELETWIKKIRPQVMELPKKASEIKRIESKNIKALESQKTKQYDFNNIDLFKEDIYDTSQLNCWSFRKGNDERENVKIALGNMCSGYPFTINNHQFSNSESAYIAGMFSNNTEEHKFIQIELQNEDNGYAAKKTIRRKYENKKRVDWEEYNVQWMLFVVWQKCLKNADFRKLLSTEIPTDAIIIENSTRQNGITASFWGAKNIELEDNRDIIERFVKFNNPYANSKELERLTMIERNQINTIGTFKGVNCMGKILKLCQIALVEKSEPPIDYELLRTKKIHLLGELLTFE
jgi:transcriptional regulator with XRE-family HTH domain/predicted NAD-dependent protein-ADP-ribosyltransferase YbiA (DUF1768 family)